MANLPTRNGGSSGKAEENRMLDNVGGPNTIRTKIVQTPEGELMLRTRGGFPEFTLKKKSSALARFRTFTFRQVDKTLGVIADFFKVLVRDVSISSPCYFVSKFRTSGDWSWSDVIRFDGAIAKVNGASVSQQITNVRQGQLPMVLGSATPKPCVSDTTRSTLFTGLADSNGFGVFSIAVDGSEKQFLTVSDSNKFLPDYGCSAGVRLGPDGCFYFYGSYSTFNNTSFTTAWSVIKCSAQSPYLQEIAHSIAGGVPIDPAVYPSFDTTYSGDGNSATVSPRALTGTVTGDKYNGADIQIDLKYTISGDAVFQNNPASSIPMSVECLVSFADYGTTHRAERISDKLGVIASVEGVTEGLVYATWVEAPWDAPVTWEYVCSGASGSVTTTVAGFAKDYVYADIDEDIFLTFEVHYTTVRVNSLITRGAGIAFDSQRGSAGITVKYVLSVRGKKHEFVVYSGSIPTAKNPADRRDNPLLTPNYAINTWGLPGAGLFSPVFMAQGNCQNVAYTTKLEQARGAAEQVYFDFTLKPKWLHQPIASTAFETHFSPINCIYALFTALNNGNASPGEYGNLGDEENEVSQILGCDVPFRVQFANGIKGVWQSRLGAGFTGYPPMEITRI